MSGRLDSKQRRGRKAAADALRHGNVATALDPGTEPQLPLLRQIAEAPDGWHADALDRFQREDLIKRGLLKLAKGYRLHVTFEGLQATRQG